LNADERQVSVLRLGHRLDRDKRVTAHLFLVARAFGANKVIYAGQRDEKLEETIRKIVQSWGGNFKVEYQKDWKKTTKTWRADGGEMIHLTMYGLPIQDIISTIRESPKDKLIVVGGAKVPGEVFKLADWNVSVTSQPHSEISALSIFLDEFFEGRELSKTFENAEMWVIPQAKGKRIVKKQGIK